MPFSDRTVTALNLQAIPSNINTYERLIVWAGMCLQDISNGDTVNVARGEQAQPRASVSFNVLANAEETFIVSAYLPVNFPALNSGEQKTWMAARDISSATPHSNLLQN